VPLLRANSDVSEASSSDIQLDQKKEHSRKFYEILEADTIGKQLKGEVTNKYWMMDDASYRETIRQIEAGLAEPGLDKLAYHRRHTLIKNYEVLEIMNIKKIIKKRKEENSPIQFLVKYEDIFECLYQAHSNIGHKGRDLMSKECSKFINVTINHITSN